MSAPRACAVDRVEVADLLLAQPRIRWVAGGMDPASGMDCHGLAVAVLRRRWPDVPASELDPWAIGTREALAAYLERFADRWERLGAEWWRATEVGDVLVTPGSTGPHLSTVYDARRRLAITTTVLHGVHSVSLHLLRDATDVLRYRGGPR